MKILPLVILTLLSTALFGGLRLVNNIQFNQNIGGHLKRAGDANQVPLAISELETAIEGMDRAGIVCHPKQECYTSIFYNTPDEDIAFWRANIEQALQDLKNLPPDADATARSNTLLKLRETLLDNGDTGTYVTVPEGLSVWPNNTAYMIFGTLVILLCGFTSFRLMVELS